MTARVPASPAAFLTEVERRAVVLAALQCADPATGDAAVAAAMRAFLAGAAGLAPATWPHRFWSLLLATPQLRRTPMAGAWPAHWRSLAVLGNGPRAALLLRLAAGLDDTAAAASLGVSDAHFEQALRRAVDHAQTWRYLATAIGQQLEAVDGERLAALRLRAQAQGVERESAAEAPADAGPAPAARLPAPARRRLRRVLWAGVAACAIAFAGTWVAPAMLEEGRDFEPRIERDALPPSDAPLARHDGDLRAWSDRDFGLLADPLPLRADPALLGWYAAGAGQAGFGEGAAGGRGGEVGAVDLVDGGTGGGGGPAALPAPEPPLPAATRALDSAREGRIAALPVAVRPALRAQAGRWAAWPAATRATFLRRQARWQALPAARRAQRREQWRAWQLLLPVERGQLRQADAALAALPAAARAQVEAAFDALDGSEQRGWLLGPALGADYPRLHPLLAQLPAAEHAPLRAALRLLEPAAREDLAAIAQRLPPGERGRLRTQLLATPPLQRAAWLRELRSR